ncbi:MAG: cobalamin-dependent protein, partial [Deltaproteobacteria bacterium]|nr:cobalamin-dependent protein [Deltaproteobacteria bacterium]
YVKSLMPDTEMGIISIPADYGLPLTRNGREKIHDRFLQELRRLKPKGVGISCTAISQAEETIHLCEEIKAHDPHIQTFVGGYFPTVYYEDIFERTSAVDWIVIGEGEVPAHRIISCMEQGKDPREADIPNLAWKEDGRVHMTRCGERFDLRKKALINLDLLKHPGGYDILPYAFSRGCPYNCHCCMEEFIRPVRKAVPREIILQDLTHLARETRSRSLLVSDTLFKSYDVFPFLRSLDMKVHFETRCDILDPKRISAFADVCGMLILGFESASFDTLRRMNKVRDRDHYNRYLSNTMEIFRQCITHEVPLMIFMIAGYPGDTEDDLKASLAFAKKLSRLKGPGGHVFKIGECHVYPKTKIHELALSLPDVIFDDDGVFGQNIVRQASGHLPFDTILKYTKEIFNLSNPTEKLQWTMLHMMPFFRLPVEALRDDMVPDDCFHDENREIFNPHGQSIATFKGLVPALTHKYRESMSDQRSKRLLPF